MRMKRRRSPARAQTAIPALDATPGRGKWLFYGIAVVIVVAATLVRVRGAMNSLWLDEIWSLHLARQVSGPWMILTSIHSDNNHYLNTFFMYLFADHGDWWGFRTLSILFGAAMVVVAGQIGNRRGRINAVLLMILLAGSYTMVLWSSEARGYAQAAFFSLLSFFFLSRYLEKRTGFSGIMFALSSAAGFLAHASFLIFFLAAFAWSAYRLLRSGLKILEFIRGMALCHGLPAAMAMFIYVADISKTTIRGGTVSPMTDRFAEAMAWTLGTALPDAVKWPLCAAALVLLGLGAVLLRRQKSDEWVFFLLVVFVVPAALLLALQPSFLYVRYFAVSMVFLLVLVSYLLTWLFDRGPWGKALCVAFVAAYLAVNAWHIAALFSLGRGQYTQAMELLQRDTRGAVVTVGGDQDLRIGGVVGFYAALRPGPKKVQYFLRGSWPPAGPEWLIVHEESFEKPEPRRASPLKVAGSQYELTKIFPAAPLSGMHWFVYHKMQ